MSRTHHHSQNWNRAHPWHRDALPDRHWASTTPSWYTRMVMNRPARAQDRLMTHRIRSGYIDPDAAVFRRVGRKPHVYYW